MNEENTSVVSKDEQHAVRHQYSTKGKITKFRIITNIYFYVQNLINHTDYLQTTSVLCKVTR